VPTDSNGNRPSGDGAVSTFEVTMADNGPLGLYNFAIFDNPTESPFAVHGSLVDTGDANKGVGTPLTVAVFDKGLAPASYEGILEGSANPAPFMSVTLSNGRETTTHTFDDDVTMNPASSTWSWGSR
jgi:hypothetical protein